jgi:hypothetical protein
LIGAIGCFGVVLCKSNSQLAKDKQRVEVESKCGGATKNPQGSSMWVCKRLDVNNDFVALHKWFPPPKLTNIQLIIGRWLGFPEREGTD